MMKEVAGRLTTDDDLPNIDAAVRPFYRDVWDHVQRAEYRLNGLRDIAASVIETNGMLEQQRQGVITRQLAAWAAILAVPTAIAGIYGMNFEFMPELDWAFGYPFALAQIGRASCRERVCQFVSSSVVAVSLKQKNNYTFD